MEGPRGGVVLQAQNPLEVEESSDESAKFVGELHWHSDLLTVASSLIP